MKMDIGLHTEIMGIAPVKNGCAPGSMSFWLAIRIRSFLSLVIEDEESTE